MQQQAKPAKMLKQIATMQANMMKARKQLEESQYEGRSGGNLVKVIINGKGDTLSVTVDPSILTEDAQTVADLFQAAANSAQAAKEAAAKEVLKASAGGLLGAGFQIPGLG